MALESLQTSTCRQSPPPNHRPRIHRPRRTPRHIRILRPRRGRDLPNNRAQVSRTRKAVAQRPGIRIRRVTAFADRKRAEVRIEAALRRPGRVRRVVDAVDDDAAKLELRRVAAVGVAGGEGGEVERALAGWVEPGREDEFDERGDVCSGRTGELDFAVVAGLGVGIRRVVADQLVVGIDALSGTPAALAGASLGNRVDEGCGSGQEKGDAEGMHYVREDTGNTMERCLRNEGAKSKSASYSI